MSASYDGLAAIDMERVAGHPAGGGVAQCGDAVGGAKPGSAMSAMTRASWSFPGLNRDPTPGAS
jgi:hypothetical protein